MRGLVSEKPRFRFIRRKILLVLLILLVLSVLPCSFTYGKLIDVYLREGAWLLISDPQVDLGTLKVDPSGQAEYFEETGAIQILFQCLSNREWKVLMDGDIFRSGVLEIPLTQLEWDKGGGYKKMPPNGSPALLAEDKDYPGSKSSLHSLSLSYRLKLTGEEFAGDYSSEIEIMMFFP